MGYNFTFTDHKDRHKNKIQYFLLRSLLVFWNTILYTYETFKQYSYLLPFAPLQLKSRCIVNIPAWESSPIIWFVDYMTSWNMTWQQWSKVMICVLCISLRRRPPMWYSLHHAQSTLWIFRQENATFLTLMTFKTTLMWHQN